MYIYICLYMYKEIDPTKICTGKGAVTLRASSSYREIPSSGPVSPQETPKHESKPGALPMGLGEVFKATWEGREVLCFCLEGREFISCLLILPGAPGSVSSLSLL